MALLALVSCKRASPETPLPASSVQGNSVAVQAAPSATPRAAEVSARDGCAEPATVYDAGRVVGTVCSDDAAKQGLTVLDLGDAWTPAIFDDDAALGAKGKQPYRDTLIALEAEQFGDGPEFDRAKDDKYLELYGIFPDFDVLAKRLADDERHACNQAIDNEPLLAVTGAIDPWRARDKQQSDVAYAKTLRTSLDAERARQRLDSIDALKHDRIFASKYAAYQRVHGRISAIMRTQEHLKCERLLKAKAPEGIVDYATAEAIKAYQRKHMIVSWELDQETLATLSTDSRELDYRGVLRALRERVVDATGLIEDGSARNERGLVLGRQLDAEAFRTWREDPLDIGAPDLVSPATEAAARALGWTGPAEARAFFEAHASDLASMRVAVRLPDAPSYDGKHMDLRAVIDRGDVYYDFPWTKQGALKLPSVEHRPSITLLARIGDKDVALMRWPTTIGGWKAERTHPREVMMVYKESPAGPRIWRDLIASPVWIPPENAPKREIVRARYNDSYVLNTDLFGPSYASAFGLVKLVHLREAHQRTGDTVLQDEGVGTHGSVSYDSIHHGSSHGCHRLFNHESVRLGDFLLKHRNHEAKGVIELGYGRQVAWQHKSLTLKMEKGGFRYELTPPVPVEVLRGRIMSGVTAPLKAKPVPEAFAKQFLQDRFED
ncbi:MAG TPA: hypothetical protein VGM56_04585 [Byssovorax sp.]